MKSLSIDHDRGGASAFKASTVRMPMMQIRIMRVLVANGLVPMPV
jgi:hypothetical protein